MTKEEIRMINEKLDFYVMEASDEEFDTEEVRKLVKRLDELDPIPLPWKSDVRSPSPRQRNLSD